MLGWVSRRRREQRELALMRQRLAVLEHLVDVRDSQLGQLRAIVAAYERAVAGDGPSLKR